jgi:hypothetical protein
MQVHIEWTGGLFSPPSTLSLTPYACYSPIHPRGRMFRKINLIWEIPDKAQSLPGVISKTPSMNDQAKSN